MVLEAVQLPLPSGLYSLLDVSTALSRFPAGQFFQRNRGDFHVEVDGVHEGTADLVEVALGSIDAVSVGMVEVAAGAGALPFCNITIKTRKPVHVSYPKELLTVGDHLCAARLEPTFPTLGVENDIMQLIHNQ